MKVSRSPPSPLINQNKREKIMTKSCPICAKVISAQPNPFPCSDCGVLFHPTCAFINPMQESYFHKNNIPWMCQKCYFTKAVSSSTVLAELNSTVSQIKSNLTDCLDKVTSVSSQVSAMHQEFSLRISSVETKLERATTVIKEIDDATISNSFILTGLRKKFFKSIEDTRKYILKILVVFKIDCVSSEFIFKWIKDNLVVYFLNKAVVCKIKQSYREFLCMNDHGLFSEDFSELSIVPATTISIVFEPALSDCVFRQIEDIEIARLSKELKIDGIQLLETETSANLRSYIIEIAKHLDVVITPSDFHCIRSKHSSECCVTFYDPTLRDKFFYTFLSRMQINRTGGIPAINLSTVPCVNSININESLCSSVRNIFLFCSFSFLLLFFYVPNNF